jgi:hypothetical protein
VFTDAKGRDPLPTTFGVSIIYGVSSLQFFGFMMVLYELKLVADKTCVKRFIESDCGITKIYTVMI